MPTILTGRARAGLAQPATHLQATDLSATRPGHSPPATHLRATGLMATPGEVGLGLS